MNGVLLHPLLGFTCGVVDGSVGLELEYAADHQQLASKAGDARGFVLTPDAAIELGRVLMERGEMAKAAKGPTN